MFNRQEQVALLLLSGALLVGAGLTAVDYYHPSTLEEFCVVPQAVEVPDPVALEGGPVAGPVRLNAATAAQLQGLPSIGPQMAGRILDYRREHGPFTSVDGLCEVRGIGPRTLESLRPLVTLD